MAPLTSQKLAIISCDYFEEKELTSPRNALLAHGANVDVIAPHKGTIQGLKHLKTSEKIRVDKTFEEADPSDYDGLIIPGGVFNADQLRMEHYARYFATTFIEEGKLIAAICHAPWLLVSADVIAGRQLTSYFTIQDDIRNAGGIWVNEEVVRDFNLITSRNTDDLPAFNSAIINHLNEMPLSTTRTAKPIFLAG